MTLPTPFSFVSPLERPFAGRIQTVKCLPRSPDLTLFSFFLSTFSSLFVRCYCLLSSPSPPPDRPPCHTPPASPPFPCSDLTFPQAVPLHTGLLLSSPLNLAVPYLSPLFEEIVISCSTPIQAPPYPLWSAPSFLSRFGKTLWNPLITSNPIRAVLLLPFSLFSSPPHPIYQSHFFIIDCGNGIHPRKRPL